MPIGHGHFGHGHFGHHHHHHHHHYGAGNGPVNVIDEEKKKRIVDRMADKEKLNAYLASNPFMSQQMWHNPNIVDKLDANPALLDDLNADPEAKLVQLMRENPPPSPNSECCAIL